MTGDMVQTLHDLRIIRTCLTKVNIDTFHPVGADRSRKNENMSAPHCLARWVTSIIIPLCLIYFCSVCVFAVSAWSSTLSTTVKGQTKITEHFSQSTSGWNLESINIWLGVQPAVILEIYPCCDHIAVGAPIAPWWDKLL